LLRGPASRHAAAAIALGWAVAGLVVVGVLSARGVSFAGLVRAVDDAEPQEIAAESHA
jgi:hypothetical protein